MSGDQNVILNQFSQLRQECASLHQKMNELDQEKNEHTLVLDAITPLNPDRKCFRMVGGVLVERTVKEVAPAVQRNRDGIADIITKMQEQLEAKEKEMLDFQEKHKIKVKGDGNSQGAEMAQGPSSGVLV
eukprot:GFYU01006140.1.p1 GENE.GFYU01006140.1~~GFYU01006140.1.p1  ORF type:complete len:147 (-),score=53.26 GFYU01006140.1:418-807(-)